MSTFPSFTTLYRQSRYTRADVDGQHATKQNRQELFAVAGVAFVLKHDESFRQAFLRKICDATVEELDGEIEIRVQPASHADLRLRIRCQGKQTLYIVEFKVGAQLQSKQDPSDEEAFFAQTTGYGWIIQNAPEYRDCIRKTYIVLQNTPAFADQDRDEIRVRARTWRQLIDRTVPEGSLTRDLLDTLGGWGMASLKFRHMTGMKNAPHTRQAADIFQVITAIAEELEIRPKKYDFDVQSDTDGAHFGLNFPFALKQFTKLANLAGPNEDALGWFGYESGSDAKATLDVWIYCKSSKAVVSPQSKVLAHVQKCLGSGFSGSITSEEGQVRISTAGDAVEDDKEWFSNAFSALRDKAG